MAAIDRRFSGDGRCGADILQFLGVAHPIADNGERLDRVESASSSAILSHGTAPEPDVGDLILTSGLRTLVVR
jgi:hypothetical protein